MPRAAQALVTSLRILLAWTTTMYADWKFKYPLYALTCLHGQIYFGMVGDCAFQPNGCSLTWRGYLEDMPHEVINANMHVTEPFVDWFYNTIQATNTSIWPEYVLST